MTGIHAVLPFSHAPAVSQVMPVFQLFPQFPAHGRRCRLPPPLPASIHITADANHDHAIIAAALTFTHHDHHSIQTFVEDNDITCGLSTPPPPPTQD
jgi:hypothetical protein